MSCGHPCLFKTWVVSCSGHILSGVGGCGCPSHKGPQKVRSLHASLCLEYAGPPAVLRRRRGTLDSPGSLVGPSDDHSMHAHARFMSAGQRRVQEAASRTGPQPAWPDAPRCASRRTERAPRWRYSNFRSFYISFLTILAHFPRGERVAEGRVRLSDAPCDVLAERGILIGRGKQSLSTGYKTGYKGAVWHPHFVPILIRC